MSFLKSLALRALLLLALGGAGPAHAAPVYHVSVDTSSLSGQSGYLDFLFLGLAGATPAVARLSNFTGAYAGPDFVLGEVSGSPASGVAIGNGAGWNEYALWAGFGGMFGFDLEFSVAPGSGAGTTLAVALLDGQFGYLGAGADIAVFALQPGQPDAVAADAAFAVVTAVPEPSGGLLFATGFLLLARRRRLCRISAKMS